MCVSCKTQSVCDFINLIEQEIVQPFALVQFAYVAVLTEYKWGYVFCQNWNVLKSIFIGIARWVIIFYCCKFDIQVVRSRWIFLMIRYVTLE